VTRASDPSREASSYTLAVSYQIDLAQLHPHELRRTLGPEDLDPILEALTAAKLAGQTVLAPDIYPETLELRVAQEEDWDALGASLNSALAAKAMRDELHELDFVQVGAFRLEGLPYPRNFFAYTKTNDTFGALYLSDLEGPAPYLELFTLHRPTSEAARAGMLGIVSSSAATPEPLDPSPNLTWLPDAGVSPAQLFQLHRNKVIGVGKANIRAETSEDFCSAYLEIWNANFESWRERGVLVQP
jgi:hypothetical protein